MKWISKPTGDMTLSVVDENEFQILKVDMLKAGIMKAGTDGAILCKTINDLTLIAGFSDKKCLETDDLPYPDFGISPLPWSIQYDVGSRSITIKSAKNKKVASRIFPARISDEDYQMIVKTLQDGLAILNNRL